MSRFYEIILYALISCILAFVALTFNNPLLILAASLALITRGFFKRGFIISFWSGVFFSLLSRSGGILDLGIFSAYLIVVAVVLYGVKKVLLESRLCSLLLGAGLVFFSSLVIFGKIFCFISWFALVSFLFLSFYPYISTLSPKGKVYLKL